MTDLENNSTKAAILDTAQALYKAHNVQEISRSDSGAINLSRTSACFYQMWQHRTSNKYRKFQKLD